MGRKYDHGFFANKKVAVWTTKKGVKVKPKLKRGSRNK
jgi:hypothetical protein